MREGRSCQGLLEYFDVKDFPEDVSSLEWVSEAAMG